MSLSQFVYSLAGMEDQIPDSQLASAAYTPEKSGLGEVKLTLPSSTTMLSYDEVAPTGPTNVNIQAAQQSIGSSQEPASPTKDWFTFGLPTSPPLEASGTIPDVSPETPTSFLGYFFGGTGEPVSDVASPSIEIDTVDAVPMEPASPPIGVQESAPEDAGFGSFLWTLVAGEEGEVQPEPVQPDDVPVVPQATIEEQPRVDVPQPSYTAKKPNSAQAGGSTDSDAEEIVDRIEQGGESGAVVSSGKTSRKSIMSDMEIKMKLNEAKVSLRKLKEIQKETNTLLGMNPTPPIIDSVRTFSPMNDVNASPRSIPAKDTSSKPRKVKKFVPRYTKPYVPYKAKLTFNSLNAPVSDRLKSYPPSFGGTLHAHQPMPFNNSGNFPRDVVVVSSVEARSLRQI